MKTSNEQSVTFGPLLATLCFAILIAWGGSFIPETSAFGVKIKSYQLFADLISTQELPLSALKKKPKAQLGAVMITENDSNQLASDTSLSFGLPAIQLPEYPDGPIPIEDFGDSSPNLKYFIQALDSLQLSPAHRKVRIGYFGDSAIEGDLVTQDLRRFFQQTYGGRGVGWVPITSPVAAFRTTIQHQFSEEWMSYTWMSPKRPTVSMGWGGTLGIPSYEKASWVRYQQRGLPVNASLYLRNRHTQHQLTIGNQQVEVDSSPYLQRFSLGGSKSNRLEWPAGVKDEVYGISFESEQGVILDNLSLRGNSGLPLAQLNVNLTKQFIRYMPYQCLVLQYGLNVASPELTSLYWYEVGLRRTVRHLKKLFPFTTILIVGVGDKSARINGTYQTDPSIPHILYTQRKIAMEEQVCFWSLFHAMGGENAALDWIAQSPPLLAKDYTHLSPAGAKKVAALIQDAFTTAINPKQLTP